MKKLLIGAIALLTFSPSFAQKEEEVTKKNSWLKAGVNLGVPVGDISNSSSFAAGVDLSGQFMATKNFGIGIASGYTQFFKKDNGANFGTVPLGLLLRYYPQNRGFFAGADVGYTFLTNANGADGGLYVRPQLGYHNYDWNLFAFYNQTFRNVGVDIQTVGVAATYNIRFK
jgi:hypothetical protein